MVDDWHLLIARSPQAFREKQGIDARVGHKISEIDLGKRQVLAEDLSRGKNYWEPFDHLLIATGALPIRPPIPNINAQGVYVLNTLQSGLELRQALEEKKIKNIVIIGGGYIGLEAAENFARRKLDITIIEKMPQLMNTLDADMAALLIKPLEDMGIKIHLNEALTGIETLAGEVKAVMTEQRTIPADLVLLGLGVRPNSSLAKAAGIPIGKTGGIKVNNRLQTDVEKVWAAGNCAETFHLVSRRPFFVALGTVANKQGRIAGLNIAGSQATFPGVVGTAMVKVGHLEVARTGLQERELQELGLPYVSAKIEAQTKARYFPGTQPITVKIFAEKGSGRLLGGQIVGGEGAGKRIDTIATALHAGLNVEDFLNLDLGYSPPFSPVWDPVLIAARQLVHQV